jgi:AcrR family transcriptional regulator
MCARPANPELREQIVKTATRIVEGCGPDCVTMREVAAEVGYSPTTLYLYFKDKDAILSEVVVEGFDDLADFCAMSAVGPMAVDKFRQRARAYIVWGIMHPSLYQLMFETRIDTERTPEEIARISRSAVEGWQALDDAIEAREVRGIDDPTGFGVAVWAGTHGVTSLAISRRLSASAATAKPDELLAEATRLGDTLVDGMLAPHLKRRSR